MYRLLIWVVALCLVVAFETVAGRPVRDAWAGAGLVELAIWLYALRADGLVPASISPVSRRYVTAQILPAPVVFGLSIPVAFVAPGVAPFTWILLVPIGRLLPRIMRAKETPKPDT